MIAIGKEDLETMDTGQTSSKEPGHGVILPGFDEPMAKSPKELAAASIRDTDPEADLGPEPDLEPLPRQKEALPEVKAKKKKPRTQKERRADAIQKHNRGHVVNPTGGPDLRLRKFDWQKARDIGREGAVTTAQLWRYLHLRYEEAFGDGILEGQMPQDRYAIAAWFDKLKQRFLKTCGHQVDNRELSEYFAWILDPARLDSMMGMGKLTASKNYLRVEQVQGAVYVQRFYNEVLRRKAGVVVDTVNEHVRQWQRISDEVHDAFDFMAETADTDVGMIISMVRYGFPLMLQFMMERKGMSEGQARKCLVNVMKDFIRSSKDFDGAKKYVEKAMEATARFEFTYNKYTVWKDWREKCDGLIEEASKGAQEEKDAEKQGADAV
jgi:hypothetical protein